MLQDVRRPLPPCTALCAGCCNGVLQARIFLPRGVARIWDEREVNLPSMDVGEKSLTHQKMSLCQLLWKFLPGDLAH